MYQISRDRSWEFIKYSTGSSADDHMRSADHLDAATSFTISMASGNLTHRRPISPANSSAGKTKTVYIVSFVNSFYWLEAYLIS